MIENWAVGRPVNTHTHTHTHTHLQSTEDTGVSHSHLHMFQCRITPTGQKHTSCDNHVATASSTGKSTSMMAGMYSLWLVFPINAHQNANQKLTGREGEVEAKRETSTSEVKW